MSLCKGGCGNIAVYSGWCNIKWKTKNRICVNCTKIEERRARSISRYRLKESKLGLNPMQNQKICKKNHSTERNKKAAESLRELGKLRLLPQQTESKYKSRMRLLRIRKALQKLASEGKMNHQIESEEKRKSRYKKISITLKSKIKNGTYKLPIFKKRVYKSKKNGIVYLRSKWELEVAKFLDKRKIPWLYEKYTFPYWNPEKKEIRYTIPDFFLPESNIFIEVKSDWGRILNPSLYKIKGVREAGYQIILWKQKQIEFIRNHEYGRLLAEIETYGEKDV